MVTFFNFLLNETFQFIGIEPAKNVAEEALKKGIPTIIKFFDKETANDLVKAKQASRLVDWKQHNCSSP